MNKSRLVFCWEFYLNVCSQCNAKFVVLTVLDEDTPASWMEQVATFCPYCGSMKRNGGRDVA